jgi:Fe-S-cluster-containing dehydrogenase component
MRSAFVFDVNKCTGCGACQLACTIENGLAPDVSWRHVTTFNEPRHPGIPLFHLSLACNHCAEPACMDACPALAYERDDNTGAVLINQDACIGCGYCAWACPFDAPKLDHDRGVMTKCTFCNHRLAEGRTPACASLCPTGALRVERVAESDLHQPVAGFPQTELRPAIRIIPPRGDVVAAAGTAAPMVPPERAPGAASPPSKITLAKEWPLAIFTWATPLLFALVAACILGAGPGPDLPTPSLLRFDVPAFAALFALLAGAGMLLGSAHLGRKERAWRIVLNVRRSPLSREIVSFSLFAPLGLAYLWLGSDRPWLGVLAAAAGALVLFAVEDVYRFALRDYDRLPHSANVVLSGPYLAACVTLAAGVVDSRLLGIATGLGAVKLFWYYRRKAELGAANARRTPLVTAARLAFTVAGLAALTLGGPGWLGLVAVLIAELIDRCELYTELRVMTPRLKAARDLAELTGSTVRTSVL